MEQKLTAKDHLINKLLMKNNALRTGVRKAEIQLRSKEEGRDAVPVV